MKLVTLCMATDNRDAFSRLVVAYQEELRRFILNLTSGDGCLTDDIAQDTFLKAWLGIKVISRPFRFQNMAVSNRCK